MGVDEVTDIRGMEKSIDNILYYLFPYDATSEDDPFEFVHIKSEIYAPKKSKIVYCKAVFKNETVDPSNDTDGDNSTTPDDGGGNSKNKSNYQFI